MRTSRLLALVLFTTACTSDDLARARMDGGTGASATGGFGGQDAAGGATGGSTGGNAGDSAVPDAGCSGGYKLTSYFGDAGGLCAADDSTMCSCFELTQAITVACDPAGAGCVKLSAYCAVCGWFECENVTPSPACDPYATILPDVWASAGTSPCSKDADCMSGTLCTLRIGNRMFCE